MANFSFPAILHLCQAAELGEGSFACPCLAGSASELKLFGVWGQKKTKAGPHTFPDHPPPRAHSRDLVWRPSVDDSTRVQGGESQALVPAASAQVTTAYRRPEDVGFPFFGGISASACASPFPVLTLLPLHLVLTEKVRASGTHRCLVSRKGEIGTPLPTWNRPRRW